MRIQKAVIPVAGLGTRFLPATKAIPKEMIPIIDKPMIQYIVEECVGAGIQDIVFVIARGKDAILDHFDKNSELEKNLFEKGQENLLSLCQQISSMVRIVSVRQKEALGLGHAVLTARPVVGNEPFVVLLGDDLIVSKTPCIKQLMAVYEQHHLPVIGVMPVPRKDVSKYGIIEGPFLEHSNDRIIQVKTMVEKPKAEEAPSNFACPGRYVLTPRIFDFLERAKPGAGGEIQLTDALRDLSLDSGLLAYLFEGRRYDTGDKLGYIEATLAFALERPELKAQVRAILSQYLS